MTFLDMNLAFHLTLTFFLPAVYFCTEQTTSGSGIIDIFDNLEAVSNQNKDRTMAQILGQLPH